MSWIAWRRTLGQEGWAKDGEGWRVVWILVDAGCDPRYVVQSRKKGHAKEGLVLLRHGT
jgi:hypothetical protein